MALAPGVRLGPYEIVSALGAGAWARCAKPATPASTARSPSRCCRLRSLPTRNDSRISNRRRSDVSRARQHVCVER